MSLAVPTLKEFSLLEHYLYRRGDRTNWGHPLMLLVGEERHTNLVRLLSECRGQFDSILVINNSDETCAVDQDPEAEACLNVLLQGSTKYTPNQFLSLGQDHDSSEGNQLMLMRGSSRGDKWTYENSFQEIVVNCRCRGITLVITASHITQMTSMIQEYCDVFVGGTGDAHCEREYDRYFCCFSSLRQMLDAKVLVESETPSLFASATSWLSSWIVSPPAPVKRCLVWRNGAGSKDIANSVFCITPRAIALADMQPLLMDISK